jgi:hypothetical protein
MARKSSTLGRITAIARLAMVLPFLALSLVPQGFMPDRNAAGDMVLVLCSGDGPAMLVIDPATGRPVEKRAACQWSVAGAAAIGPAPVALPFAPLQKTTTLAATEADLWHPAHDPRGIWARGPPEPV